MNKVSVRWVPYVFDVDLKIKRSDVSEKKLELIEHVFDHFKSIDIMPGNEIYNPKVQVSTVREVLRCMLTTWRTKSNISVEKTMLVMRSTV